MLRSLYYNEVTGLINCIIYLFFIHLDESLLTADITYIM